MDGPDDEEAEAVAIGSIMTPRAAGGPDDDEAETEAVATMRVNRDQTDLLADMGERKEVDFVEALVRRHMPRALAARAGRRR